MAEVSINIVGQFRVQIGVNQDGGKCLALVFHVSTGDAEQQDKIARIDTLTPEQAKAMGEWLLRGVAMIEDPQAGQH